MTPTLFDVDGQFIGYWPEWLSMPASEHSIIQILVRRTMMQQYEAEKFDLRGVNVSMMKLTFYVRRGEFGSTKIRVADRETQAQFDLMKRDAETWG